MRLRHLLTLGLLAGALFFAGCKATLEQGGAYAPTVVTTNSAGVVTTNYFQADLGFYTTEAAFLLAAQTLDTAFRFERDNQATLWKLSPEIKRTLDKIRPSATEAVFAYKAARKIYKASPTTTGLTLLQTILARVQTSAAAASAALTTATSTK
jgi:hypothetical protein